VAVFKPKELGAELGQRHLYMSATKRLLTGREGSSHHSEPGKQASFTALDQDLNHTRTLHVPDNLLFVPEITVGEVRDFSLSLRIATE